MQQQVSEFSRNLADLRKETARIGNQIGNADYEHKANILALREFASFSNQATKPNCYSAFGKMFIKQEFDSILSQIERSNQELEKELEKLLEQHKLMETRVNKKQDEFQNFLQKNGFTLKPVENL